MSKTKKTRLLPLAVILLLSSQEAAIALQGMSERRNQEKTEQASMSAFHFRQRAFYIAYGSAESNVIEHPLEAAQMRADFASLICAFGERTAAVETFNKSLDDVATYLLGSDPRDNDEASEALELALRVSEKALACDPLLRGRIVDRLAELRAAESGRRHSGVTGETELESAVVPDSLWGSRPSIRRRLAAEILARAAHANLSQGKLGEAESLLDQSLSHSLVLTFVTPLLGLKNKGSHAAASKLYLKAAGRVQAQPSGAELYALWFGLRPMLGVGHSEDLYNRLASAEPSRDALVMSYVDAVSALTGGPGSMLAAKSADTVRLVKAALPLYSRFRPQLVPRMEEWITKATERLAPSAQDAVHTAPFVARPENTLMRLEEIADKSVDEEERDLAYASIVSKHLEQATFDKAIEAGSKVRNLDLRREVLDAVAYRETLFSLAKPIDLRTLHRRIGGIASLSLRAKLYTRLAQVAAKGDDRVLATESLQEAARLAAKLDPGPTQSHLLLGVAAAYADFDHVRAFETLSDAVKAINRHSGQPASRWAFAEVDSTTIVYDRTGRFARQVFDEPSQYRRPYQLSAFRKLAAVDFDGVLLAAAQINDKRLQLSARYEICSGILYGCEQ